jgi:hypothetical protein
MRLTRGAFYSFVGFGYLASFLRSGVGGGLSCGINVLGLYHTWLDFDMRGDLTPSLEVKDGSKCDECRWLLSRFKLCTNTR